jgi:hypothetical protein
MMPPPGPPSLYNNVSTSRRGSRSFTTSFRPPINNENLEMSVPRSFVGMLAKIEFEVDEKWSGMAVMLEHGGKGNKGMYV